MMKIFGMDRALYKVYGLNKAGKRVGCVHVIAHTKFAAYEDAMAHLPRHEGYDYSHIRFAREGEMCGVVLKKNDRKRKR